MRELRAGSNFVSQDPDRRNGRCTFRVSLCVNNTDPRLPDCAAGAAGALGVSGPDPGSADPADVANRAAVADAVAALGLTAPAPLFANATPDRRSAPMAIVVPLERHGRRLRKGRRTLAIESTNSGGAADADALTLEGRRRR